MARPIDADSAATYDKLLAAAVEELGETVPRTSISVRAVAERAGVSVGTLQYYFSTKNELLEACLDSYYERLRKCVDELFELLGSSEVRGPEVIERAMRSLVAFVRRERILLELRLATNSLRGELPFKRQHDLGTLVQLAAIALEPHSTLSGVELRLAIQLLTSGTLRLAMMNPQEVEAVTGDEQMDEVVERFLVGAAAALLCNDQVWGW